MADFPSSTSSTVRSVSVGIASDASGGTDECFSARRERHRADVCGDCSGMWGDCNGACCGCSGVCGDCNGMCGDCSSVRGLQWYVW